VREQRGQDNVFWGARAHVSSLRQEKAVVWPVERVIFWRLIDLRNAPCRSDSGGVDERAQFLQAATEGTSLWQTGERLHWMQWVVILGQT